MSNQPMIVRHKLIDRICHWVIVFVGLVTFLTGFAFFFPSFQWLSGIVGTPQLAKVMHPFFGIAMCVLLAVMLLRYYNHNKWNRYDLPWMKAIVWVLLQKEENIPPVGHYNPGQKMLFRSFVVFVLAFIVTGFMMWQPYFAPMFSAEAVNWATLIHSACGILMLIALVVHVWMACWIEGSITGMLYGKVSKAWARKHHPAMLNEHEDN
ncbi:MULTISPECIES: formate dehydrogenase subunit gamma [Shewanella]|jgi:formate dehydrogenase subunit gamma|uniref:Formate dehydrogenase subunit gamma n=3 Tax=Bacteria TaxID=2 RepID=A0A2T3H732_9GAMM|nr:MULTISPECIES: formate dehydrogenase subunit gamma [Shewanella]AXQ14720.1 formate dehydrogenase subunit gamma [Shewanella algae]AYV12469.1 formate dehydrogenase subunit gamma [Shewanella algae]EKT4486563.1 formate dehydrogenase subunit gamma [Shewanella algae]MBO2549617.1 formate dehydrogenase subunit gamma [Shewanella algae]MBO2551097.1 formate dehydrogenase subunit gamma [Shewanella algae]